MVNYFWDGLVANDPGARFIVEFFLYRKCKTDNQTRLYLDASLHIIEVTGLEIPISFSIFGNNWTPIGGWIGTMHLNIITSKVIHVSGQDDNDLLFYCCSPNFILLYFFQENQDAIIIYNYNLTILEE